MFVLKTNYRPAARGQLKNNYQGRNSVKYRKIYYYTRPLLVVHSFFFLGEERLRVPTDRTEEGCAVLAATCGGVYSPQV